MARIPTSAYGPSSNKLQTNIATIKPHSSFSRLTYGFPDGRVREFPTRSWIAVQSRRHVSSGYNRLLEYTVPCDVNVSSESPRNFCQHLLPQPFDRYWPILTPLQNCSPSYLKIAPFRAVVQSAPVFHTLSSIIFD